MNDSQRVLVAVTRKVKPGKEAEFERAIREFFVEASQHSSTEGHFLIRPALPGGNEYGILRSFMNRSDQEEFYRSSTFQKWLTRVEPLVDGVPVRRELHGLEAFFRNGQKGSPPRWKMAIVTWLGVFPMVVLWSNLLRPLVSGLHAISATAVVTLLVVASLAWVVMPGLTKLLAKWLHAQGKT